MEESVAVAVGVIIAADVTSKIFWVALGVADDEVLLLVLP